MCNNFNFKIFLKHYEWWVGKKLKHKYYKNKTIIIKKIIILFTSTMYYLQNIITKI